MKALILAAGYGTRLYPLIKDTPKALLPIGEATLIDVSVDKIVSLPSLSEILVVTNRKFHRQFETWAARTRRRIEVPLTVIDDGTSTPETRLGSIGDIRLVVERLGLREDLLVFGGDNIFTDGLGDFAACAGRRAPAVTIGVYDIGDFEAARKFGVLEMTGDGRVTMFEEKPQEPRSTMVAMCVYYFPAATLPWFDLYARETGATDKAGDYIHWLLDRTDVYGSRFDGRWYDIGSIEAYREAQRAFPIS